MSCTTDSVAAFDKRLLEPEVGWPGGPLSHTSAGPDSVPQRHWITRKVI